jgi:Mlc titration factor MtfA (ptsG expression regulator)
LIFGFRRRRRRRLMEQPLPAGWRDFLIANFTQYAWLTQAERARLDGLAQILVAEKNWEGCNGLVMTDEVRVTIAAQAALLVLGLDDEYYQPITSVLVYPGTYVARETRQQPGGVIVESDMARLGEAWEGGALVLAWPAVLESGRVPDDGFNVVFHEFAHVLDMKGHGFDGAPLLQSREQYRTWAEVMTAEYRRLIRLARRGRDTLLDPYGAVSEAEFFAVATECFFEQPLDLVAEHPAMYAIFRDFFRQDPAERFLRAGYEPVHRDPDV